MRASLAQTSMQWNWLHLNPYGPVPLSIFMTYQDHLFHPRVAGRIRRWLGREERQEAVGKPRSWQERVFDEVGHFLFDNGLDPTPDNYDLSFQYRAAHNVSLQNAINAELKGGGKLSSDAADRIFADHGAPVNPDALAAMVDRIDLQVDGLSKIASRSGADAVHFSQALEGSCASAAPDPSAVLELTLAMMARSRAAEADLRKATRELQDLRAHLAEAQHFADVDPLTELANRRAFKRELDRGIASCRKAGKPLSLAFCDIDHFKRLNDLHGHETGDRVLRFVAQLMAKQFAETGFVGRFGGEEFVVMFPGLDVEQARAAVDKCRSVLADLPLYAASSGERIGAVSFTAGVTLARRGDAMADMLRRADETLYRGKAEGRNCVLIG